jgi:hypothetical protein
MRDPGKNRDGDAREQRERERDCCERATRAHDRPNYCRCARPEAIKFHCIYAALPGGSDGILLLAIAEPDRL